MIIYVKSLARTTLRIERRQPCDYLVKASIEIRKIMEFVHMVGGIVH